MATDNKTIEVNKEVLASLKIGVNRTLGGIKISIYNKFDLPMTIKEVIENIYILPDENKEDFRCWVSDTISAEYVDYDKDYKAFFGETQVQINIYKIKIIVKFEKAIVKAGKEHKVVSYRIKKIIDAIDTHLKNIKRISYVVPLDI